MPVTNPGTSQVPLMEPGRQPDTEENEIWITSATLQHFRQPKGFIKTMAVAPPMRPGRGKAMTKLEALEALKAKVGAGTLVDESPSIPTDVSIACDVAFGPELLFRLVDAFEGDLNAAMALHNAVLPGWEWWVNSQHYWDGSEGPLAILRTGVPGIDLKVATGKDDNPARALLLATIKALIEKEKEAAKTTDLAK